MSLKNFKYYLFDFDGTLVDSMPTYSSNTLKILDEYGVSYDNDIIRTVTPLGAEGTAKYFIEKMGLKEDFSVLVQKMYDYALYAYVNYIPAKANVIETLKALKEKGASLNVLTASPHITLDPCLKRLNIFDLFDNVWSCEDFFTTKQDPQIYHMACEKMGVKVEEALFLDDNLNADKTAKLAGMKVCGVFDQSSSDMVEQMKKANDYYIYDFKELI